NLDGAEGCNHGIEVDVGRQDAHPLGTVIAVRLLDRLLPAGVILGSGVVVPCLGHPVELAGLVLDPDHPDPHPVLTLMYVVAAASSWFRCRAVGSSIHSRSTPAKF